MISNIYFGFLPVKKNVFLPFGTYNGTGIYFIICIKRYNGCNVIRHRPAGLSAPIESVRFTQANFIEAKGLPPIRTSRLQQVL